MITRVTVSLDPVDVDLIDRLAAVQGINRSAQVREFLAALRPTIRQTVEVLEAAMRQRDDLLRLMETSEGVGLAEVVPEVERIQATVLGAMARLEGALAVREARREVEGPPASNHGGHTPTPPFSPTGDGGQS